MSDKKTKSIKDIERKMEDMDASTMRYHVLQNAKKFKTSWIDLGQMLHAVWKDRLYKDWGYESFETYTSKEIGIRKQTALKLLRSYSFLEKEEPRYLKKDYNENAEAVKVPTYEAVDVLRKASDDKDIDRSDYSRIRNYVLEKGRDARDVKKDLAEIRKKKEELKPEEDWQKTRRVLLKRFVNVLKSVKKEIKISKLLPANIMKEADSLIEKIESEITAG